MAALPVLCLAAYAAAAGPQIKPGFLLFDRPQLRFSCQLPESWKNEAFPAGGPAGAGRSVLVATSGDGRAKITVKAYNGKHPVWSSPEGFVAKEAGAAKARPIRIGRKGLPGYHFERRSAGRRETFVVLPQRHKPRFYVFEFSAGDQAYAEHYIGFQTALRTLVMKRSTKLAPADGRRAPSRKATLP